MKDFLVKLIKNPYVLNLLLAVVVACALVFGTLKWLDSYTRHNEAVVVPDVKGLGMEEAAEFFKNSNLRYNVIDSVFSKDVKPGAIVELVPMAGSKVKEGRIVFVTVNALTSQMATIPEVEDLSFRQAYAILRARGFEKIEIEYVPGDFKDLALGVELHGRVLQKGEHVPLTAPLVLKVSSGDAEMPADSLGLPDDSVPVESLDSVTIMMTRPPRTFEILPENIPIKIVYEDDDLLVVDKPAGLVVHPGHGNYTGTLVNALAWYLKDDPTYDPNDPALGLVHRIDKDTSGLLVVAKKPEAKAHLSMQFFHKTTKREYRALVWGIVREDEGRIEGNIGRNPRDRMQMTVFPEGDQGKTAVTHYSVLERLGYVTLVKCRLETGRTHQIRVHMKYIGHTLFNDERYGGNEILKGTTSSKYKQFVDNCFAICPRQALHAKTLGFVHPTTGEEMFFDSEIPADMTALIDKWRVYANTKEL